MEEYKQSSMLTSDGTKPDSSIVSRNMDNEADLIFQTEEQKKIALDLIKEGEATDLRDAWSKMRADAMDSPVNDAYKRK